MKSIEELRNFFETTMVPDLTVLENQRKRLLTRVIITSIICGAALLSGIILFFIINFFALIVILPAVILWIILFNVFTKGYKSSFKKEVIARIIKFIDSNLYYNPEACIPISMYMKSKIFKKHPDRYRGDDYVSGKIGETGIEFSELHSEYKTTTTDSNGHTRTQWHTIFKGLFIAADFNKNFKGETYVLPDVAQSMFGKLLGNLFQSWNKTRGQLIKMEDIEFEKLFVVYGDDQIEARYILSTSLMKRITDFKNKTGKQIYISFIDNKIYTAISYSKNLFEPKLFKSLFDFDIIREYYEDLYLALGIIDELKLNTKIWG